VRPIVKGEEGRLMDQTDRRQPTPPPGPDGQALPRLTPEVVFHEYAPRVYNLARRMLGSDADADDVTHDVLLQVVRKLDTSRGEAAFPTWLHRVTVNAALAHRQKRGLRQEREVSDPMDRFRDEEHWSRLRRWSVGPEEQALDRETHELIERA